MFRSIGARLAAACVVAAAAVAGAPMGARAHAELVTSTPAANAALVDAPEAVTLTFTEPIDPQTAVIELFDVQQRPVAGLAAISFADGGVTASVRLPPLEPDVYTVSYQVVSTVDGHATAGTFAFVIDPSGAAPPPTDSETASSPSVDALTVAARWLALVMMLVALGSMVVWWNSAASAHHPAVPWGIVGVPSALAAVGVAAYLALSARPFDSPGTGIPFDVAGAYGWTPFAIAMRVAFAGALAAAASSTWAALSGRAQRALAALTTLILATGLAGMSAAGHAAASGVAFAALDWLHLVAAAAWLGGLPAALVIGRREGALGPILRRHGRVALLAAPVVALTGIANSPVVLGDARNLVASDYGNLLLAKASLLAIALGIGAVNHLALRGRGRARVVALLAAELIVAAVAVSAAATMVTIQPASARQAELATTPVNPAHLFGQVGPSRVHVTVSVPAPGDQAYRAIVSDAATGAPRADVQKVFLAFVPPPEAGLAAQRVELEPDPDPASGLYRTNGTHTPVIGEWTLEVIVRREGVRDEAVAFQLPVTTPGDPELGPPRDTGIGVPAPLAAAWSLLPDGILAWLPAVAALIAIALTGTLRPSIGRSVARGTLVGVLVLTAAAAGSRSLVEAANRPSAEHLAAQPAAPASPDVARGEAIYRANCASCHGLDLDGDGPVRTQPAAGGLRDAVDAASDRELSYRIAYGVAGTPMPAFAGLLTPDERADLVAYLRQAAARE